MGDICPEDIRAQRTVRYLNAQETNRRKIQAAEDVGRFYDAVPASRQAADELTQIFQVVEVLRRDPTIGDHDVKANLARRRLGTDVGSEMSHSALITLMSISWTDLAQIKELTDRLVLEALSHEIRDDTNDVDKASGLAAEKAKTFFGKSANATAVAEISRSVIHPNRVLNAERTNIEQKKAMDRVEPAYSQIVTGEMVISKGERVNHEHMQQFTALGLMQPKVDYKTAIALTMFMSFLVLLVIIYLARYQPKVYASTKLLALLSLVIILTTLCLNLSGTMLGLKLSLAQLGYVGVMAVTTCGMLLAVLVNPQVAVMVVSLLSITSGIIMNFELRFAATSLVVGLVAIYSVANIRNRADLKRAFGAIAVTNVAMVWIMGGMTGETGALMAKARCGRSLWPSQAPCSSGSGS